MIIRAGLIKIKIFLEIPSRVSPARPKLRDFYFYVMGQKEVWKAVPGFEDYEVSNLGRVKSLKCGRQKFLKQYKDFDGYLYVKLGNKHKYKKFSVHQLMAICFFNHKPCGLKNVVDHKDNNQSNNILSNLQVVTNRINCSKDKTRKYSKFIGVSFNKNMRKFVAFFKIGFKKYHIGYFDCETEANKAYLKAVSDYENFKIIPKIRVKASKYKGVCSTGKGNFYSHIRINGKTKHLGFFDNEEEAHKAREKALKSLTENF